MQNRNLTLLSLAAFSLVTTIANADIVLSEKFSGSAEVDLVGATTPDGNTWTGGAGEISRPEKAGDDAEAPAAPRFSIKQDGSTGGIPFTAYHKFSLKSGQVYTLEAALSPTNKFDNQWFSVGFCLTAEDGNTAPHQDQGTTYGQSVLSGSGYRYGWTGPDTKGMCELQGPGLHFGSVKMVLDTSNPKDYTIELFDGNGKSIHGPNSIGTPAISQIFLGNSGTHGAFKSVTLSDDAASPEPATGE